MATAAKVTIAEVEHLVPRGELDPDTIHTPSVYVKRIFQGEVFERRIEKRMVRKAVVGDCRLNSMSTEIKPGKDIEKRERIVKRIARELRDGFYVNIGIC